MTLFETALDEALTVKYNESIPQTEEHEFSQAFERKMKKLRSLELAKMPEGVPWIIL